MGNGVYRNGYLSDVGTGRLIRIVCTDWTFAVWGQLKWFGFQAPVTVEGDTLDCRLVWKGRGLLVDVIPIDVLRDL